MTKGKTLCLADLMKKETKGINPMKQREGLDKPSSAFLFKQQTDIKQVSNGQQTDIKQATYRYQTDIKGDSEKEKQISQGIAIRYQTDIKTDNKRISDSKLEMLVGYEKKLLLLVNEKCRFIGELTTPPITNEQIRETLQCSMGMAKLVIYRLVKKGFIKRQESKTGRGGWIKFSMPRDLYQKLNQVSNGYQLDSKEVSKGVSEGISSPSSSSSISIINKTTTEDAWFKLNITPLEPYGFTTTHIKQIIDSNKSTPTLLQKSIEYFVYMMENKIGDIKTPIPFFMSIMRNAGAIAKPVGYKSQLEKNLETLEKEEKEQKEKAKAFVTTNYERLIKTPMIQQEKEKLLKDNAGFLREDSKAFMESLKGIMIQKIEIGELRLYYD